MMPDIFLEHPDVTAAQSTGYPAWKSGTEYIDEYFIHCHLTDFAEFVENEYPDIAAEYCRRYMSYF